MGEISDLERAVLADPELMAKIAKARAELAEGCGVEDPEHAGVVWAPSALEGLP